MGANHYARKRRIGRVPPLDCQAAASHHEHLSQRVAAKGGKLLALY